MKKYLSLLTVLVLGSSTTPLINHMINNDKSTKLIKNLETTKTKRKSVVTNNEVNLNSIISESNLGYISMKNNSPTKLELLTAIINVNKKAAILTIHDFIFKDIASATSCVIMGVGNYTGEIMLQYKKKLTDLSGLITITSLNQIIFSNYMLPSKEDLLIGIKALNPLASDLTIGDFVVIDTPTQTVANIMGINNYYGIVKLTYIQQNVRVNLSSLITITNLKAINFSNYMLPSKEDLLSAILVLNPLANKLTVNDFVINDIPTVTSATIMGVGEYKGTLVLNYTQQNAQVDIAKLITVLNLGKITVIGILPPTKSQLLNAIQAVNPKAKILTLNNFALFDVPTTTNATIYAIGNNYKGAVTVTYSIL